VKKVSRSGEFLPTIFGDDRTSHYIERARMTLTLKRKHKHTAVTVHAIRQRGGVPYHVERKVCSSCSTLLGEKTLRRAAT